jgi:hypothetical protein
VPVINPPAPVGTQPTPGVTPTTQPTQPAPGVPIAPPGGATVPPPAGTVPPAGTPPPGTTPPVTTPPARDVPTTPPGTTPPGTAPAATAAQIIVTAPPELRVASGPYTIPVSVNNASRLSVLTLTITYNPAVLRVRTVQDGLFMRQGGVTASFTPRINAAEGRVDIALSRTADQTGASGAGLLAALLIDAIAPGSTAISVTGVGADPSQAPVVLTFAPVTVTVR